MKRHKKTAHPSRNSVRPLQLNATQEGCLFLKTIAWGIAKLYNMIVVVIIVIATDGRQEGKKVCLSWKWASFQ